MGWIPPDQVIPRALRVLEANAKGPAKICIVRDDRGRIRIAVGDRAVRDTKALADELTKALAGWFAGPIIDGGGSRAHRRIASELLRAPPAWPVDWPTELENAAGATVPIPEWFIGRIVLHSKESWLDKGRGAGLTSPRVVSFYSFKGGVGRTTTLCCVAARLAERGLRVVALDLDLEAPGTGAFLGARSPIGVLDHLLSHLATGETGDVEPEPVDGFPNLWVVSAGTLGPGYVEKLARLDFIAGSGGGQVSPAQEALESLLAVVAASVKPDLVLLDSRAGLHDLGGLALHRLSHADVLLARANAQARDGMRLVLGAIKRLRPVDERDVHIVQTMVPLPFESEVARPVIERWKKEMYDACLETIYDDLEEVPQLEEQAAHYPFLVGERAEFSRADRLTQVASEIMPQFDLLADIIAPSSGAEGES
jgi:cellulose biosynthesis protein BcsQ